MLLSSAAERRRRRDAATRRRRRAEERRCYAWTEHFPGLHPRVRRLSSEAGWGLHYASELAGRARERSLAALRGELLPERLTFAELARDDLDTSGADVERAIRRARVELFGRDLSDSAIRYRLRLGLVLARAERVCREEGCTRPLPPQATARRRYCDFHLASHSRVRRWRERQAAAAGEGSTE